MPLNADVFQNAMEDAWTVIDQAVKSTLGGDLPGDKLERLQRLKGLFFDFWQKARENPSYETDLVVVKNRVELLVTNVMIDGSAAAMTMVKQILEIGVEIATKLLLRLLAG